MKKKCALTINIIIVLFTILASFLMFTGIKITHGAEPLLETTKIGMFKFFTVDSNLFMGIIALLFTIKQIKNEEISKNLYKLKLMSTTAVTLTFIVVFTYLGPISKDGIKSMLQNSNLFFHLLIPVLSIINFTIFENTKKLTIKDTLYGLMPTAIYGSIYTINLIIHIENKTISPIYDWYWFAQNGITISIMTALILFIITYITSLILWKLNRR